MFGLAQHLGDKAIVHLKSSHMPATRSSALELVSGKQFEGLLKDFVAYGGMPPMLLTNFAPQFGLFNGAICSFKGLLYLPNYVYVKLNPQDLKKLKIKNLVVQQPFDLGGRGHLSRLHQLPKNTILVSINNQPVLSDDDLKINIDSRESIECQFQLPRTPPTLPDFLVVESNEYKERGGVNILGFVGAENLVPIPCRKVLRETEEKGKGCKKGVNEYRIGFMVECALAVTAYKEQGKTENKVKIHIKEFAHVPGLFNVAISRTKHPKDNYIPEGQWPNALDINLQRLNSFVLEAEIFERIVKIKASRTLRRWSVGKDRPYGELWTGEECEVADCLGIAYQNGIVENLSAIKHYIKVKLDKTFDDEILKLVIAKIEGTHERLLKEPLPYLRDVEYNRLVGHKKQKKKRTK